VLDAILGITLKVLLVSGLIVGLVAIPLGLGGTFIILGLAVLYDLSQDFTAIGVPWLIVFLVLAILGEVIESVLGSVVAQKFGARKWGMLGAFVGGIAGGIYGTPIMPVVGTLIGSILGAFAGAFVLEFIARSRQTDAAGGGLRAGYGAFIGRLSAGAIKFAIGVAITITVLIRVF
jgi:uncharacterized protein YqgC (DUF456 family)